MTEKVSTWTSSTRMGGGDGGDTLGDAGEASASGEGRCKCGFSGYRGRAMMVRMVLMLISKHEEHGHVGVVMTMVVGSAISNMNDPCED